MKWLQKLSKHFNIIYKDDHVSGKGSTLAKSFYASLSLRSERLNVSHSL